MAKNVSAQLSLDFVYSQLTLSTCIEVVGNVPAVQQFDIASGVYTPDYGNANLVLRPKISVGDPDRVVTDADLSLDPLAWYVCENGAKSMVTAGDSYAFGSDGSLIVKRNVDPDNPLTFICEGKFLDPRTNEVHLFAESQLVYAESVSVRPRLIVDAPEAIRYDPIRDTSSLRTVKVRFMQGETEVPAANREFVWQKKDADGVWADIDGTDIMDYDVSLNADRSELTVDCALIGQRIDLRVYGKYNPFGSPASLQIDSATAVETFSVVRFEPTLEGVIIAPRRFSPRLPAIKPECVVSDALGVVPNPENFCNISWYVAKGTAAGTVTKGSVVATGAKPTIPTTNVVKQYGATLVAEFPLKEPLKAATCGGKVLTYNGKVLLIR